ncbi:MAG: hypothetical protein KAW92_02250 [Candidatus Cloacimonetes bacterium]|nr:hypothetical protein [Candidatus Cloacimonadota bacterium]
MITIKRFMNKENTSIRLLYQLGGLTCMILIAYSLITMLIMVGIGTPPETIEECFSMLQENRLYGLLRLDILTVFVMPLYYLLFYSIYLALKDTNKELLSISTILVFVGLTLFLATPSVFSYLYLSDEYAKAIIESDKNQIIAAGEAILASDMWHGTGAKIGGILIQLGALIISMTMLKSNVFNKLTAYTGIVTHGLDLAHIIIGFFLPTVGIILMAIAGPLYLLWFPLIGIRLFKLKNKNE